MPIDNLHIFCYNIIMFFKMRGFLSAPRIALGLIVTVCVAAVVVPIVQKDSRDSAYITNASIMQHELLSDGFTSPTYRGSTYDHDKFFGSLQEFSFNAYAGSCKGTFTGVGTQLSSDFVAKDGTRVHTIYLTVVDVLSNPHFSYCSK